MATTRFPTDLLVEGNLQVNGTLPTYARTYLAQDDFTPFALPPEIWRVWDAVATVLPGTSASDDLGLYAGAFGTGCPYLGTGDFKTTSPTRYARCSVQLPANYVAGQTVRLAVSAGMVTTVADGSATVDFQAYKTGENTLVSGSDLVTTAAQSINSLTFAEKTFDLTATSLAAGDWLDIRVTVAAVDTATGTAVIAALAAIELQLDVKG